MARVTGPPGPAPPGHTRPPHQVQVVTGPRIAAGITFVFPPSAVIITDLPSENLQFTDSSPPELQHRRRGGHCTGHWTLDTPSMGKQQKMTRTNPIVSIDNIAWIHSTIQYCGQWRSWMHLPVLGENCFMILCSF